MLTAGCTQHSRADLGSLHLDGSPAPSRPAPPAAPHALWTTQDLRPVGDPAVSGRTAAVYEAAGGRLDLVGVSTADGSVRWRRPASPGLVHTDVAVVPTVVGSSFVYLRPDPAATLRTRLVVANPVTGKDAYVSPSMFFTTPPQVCDDDPAAACTTASAGPVGTAVHDAVTWRWSARARVLAQPSHRPTPAGSRSIGSGGLVELGKRNPEILAAYAGGHETWRRPVDAVFGAGYSTNNGWAFYEDVRRKQWMGYVGIAAGVGTSQNSLSLAGYTTVVLDQGTGRTVWRQSGTLPYCNGVVAVPTDKAARRTASAPSSMHIPTDEADLIPVRCRLSGFITFSGQGPALSEDATMKLEGFDRDTGATTWSVALEPSLEAIGFGAADGDRVLLGKHSIVVRRRGKPVSVDLVSGEAQPIAPTAPAWCQRHGIAFDYAEPYPGPGDPATQREGGTVARPCQVDGSSLDADAPLPVPNAVGTAAAKVLVVAGPTGLSGFPL